MPVDPVTNFRVFFLDERFATTPRTGEVICNAFWVVHPEKGLAFVEFVRGAYMNAQCNADGRVAKRLAGSRYPDCIIKQIPMVFPRREIHDNERHLWRL